MQARSPEENIQILGHDVITVPRADMVYVIGKVGKWEWLENSTSSNRFPGRRKVVLSAVSIATLPDNEGSAGCRPAKAHENSF